MSSPDRWIDRYAARLAFGQMLERAAEWLAVACFVFGGAVLIVKLGLPQAWPNVLWLAVIAVPVSFAAWAMARRERFTRPQAVALLDRRLGTGGMLMTLSETSDPQWEARLDAAEQSWRDSLPRIRPTRFARYLTLPLIFAVGACFVPLREAEPTPTLRNTAGQQATRELEAVLESLDQTGVLEREEEQQLRTEIEKLAEETEKQPLTHEKWEALDALRQRLKNRLDEAAAAVAKGREAVAMLSNAAGPQGQELSVEETERLEKHIREAMQKLMTSGEYRQALAEAPNELQRLMLQRDMKLPQDAEQRQQLLDQLREHLDEEWKQLLQASRSGEQRCEQCGGEMTEGECRNGNCSGHGHGSASGQAGGQQPGRGGTSRGPGEAPLNQTGQTDDDARKFREVVLPPGFLDETKDEVLGSVRTAPEVNPADAAVRGPLRNQDPATGRETWKRTLRPRHRDVVRRYFDSAPAIDIDAEEVSPTVQP